jgi:hypothetical protein
MKIKIYRCLLYHDVLLVLNRLSTASDGQRKQTKKIDRFAQKFKKGKREKELQSPRRITNNTKTDIEVLDAHIAVVARGRTTMPRIEVPGTTA